jgi:hypothetical protein
MTASYVLAVRSSEDSRDRGVDSISCRLRSVGWFCVRSDSRRGRAGGTLGIGDAAGPDRGDTNPDDPSKNLETVVDLRPYQTAINRLIGFPTA